MRELDALLRRHVQVRDHLELVAGVVASSVANFGFSRPKKWLTPADFNLGPKKRARVDRVGLDDPQSVGMLRGYFKGLAVNK